MELRFYEDPDTGQPHIYGHGVTEREVGEVLLHMNHKARPRRPSVGDNGGNRNEQAKVSPWLG